MPGLRERHGSHAESERRHGAAARGRPEGRWRGPRVLPGASSPTIAVRVRPGVAPVLSEKSIALSSPGYVKRLHPTVGRDARVPVPPTAPRHLRRLGETNAQTPVDHRPRMSHFGMRPRRSTNDSVASCATTAVRPDGRGQGGTSRRVLLCTTALSGVGRVVSENSAALSIHDLRHARRRPTIGRDGRLPTAPAPPRHLCRLVNSDKPRHRVLGGGEPSPEGTAARSTPAADRWAASAPRGEGQGTRPLVAQPDRDGRDTGHDHQMAP